MEQFCQRGNILQSKNRRAFGKSDINPVIFLAKCKNLISFNSNIFNIKWQYLFHNTYTNQGTITGAMNAVNTPFKISPTVAYAT